MGQFECPRLFEKIWDPTPLYNFKNSGTNCSTPFLCEFLLKSFHNRVPDFFLHSNRYCVVFPIKPLEKTRNPSPRLFFFFQKLWDSDPRLWVPDFFFFQNFISRCFSLRENQKYGFFFLNPRLLLVPEYKQKSLGQKTLGLSENVSACVYPR